MQVEEQPMVETPAQAETISQPEAQETVQTPIATPKVEVSKKFLKEDGTPDLEKFFKSYAEMEKQFHSPEEAVKRKTMGDILPSVSQPISSPEVSMDDIFTNPDGVIKSVVQQAVAPLQAQLKYNAMASEAEKARALPHFNKYESEIVEEIQSNPALNALFRLGDKSVFKLAHGVVVSKHYQDLETQAIARGKSEKLAINNSIPKVEGVSASPPAPAKVSKSERIKELARSGSVDAMMVDESLMTDAEKRLFGLT